MLLQRLKEQVVKGLYQCPLGALSVPDPRSLISVLDKIRDVNAIAGLVKLYFREMPEPLIPFELYPAVIAAAGTYSVSFLLTVCPGSPSEAKLNIMKNIIDLIPPESKFVLKMLCYHLYRVWKKKVVCS